MHYATLQRHDNRDSNIQDPGHWDVNTRKGPAVVYQHGGEDSHSSGLSVVTRNAHQEVPQLWNDQM